MIEQEVSDPEIVELDQSRQVRAEKAIAELLAVDDGIMGQDLDPAQIELFAVMVNGAMVRAANWWLSHLETPREVVLESLMDFIWLGMDRIRSGDHERVSA